VYRLALAYLLRRWTQLLAVFGVGVGLFSLLMLLSVMNGLIEADRASVRGPLSDLLLIPAVEAEPPSWQRYRDALEDTEGVRAVAPHLVAYAVLGRRGTQLLMRKTTSSDLNGVQLVGIDPELELAVSGFRDSLLRAKQAPVEDPSDPFAGFDPEAFDYRAPILVSDLHVRDLHVRRQERLRFGALPPILPGPEQPFEAVNGSFDVAGSYAPTDYKLGMDRMYLRREDLRANLLGDRSVEFSEILVDLEEGADPIEAKTAILAALAREGLPAPGGAAGGSLETWEERVGVYLAAIENERRVTGLVMFFVVIVAAFGLFATLSALVRAKVKDLGILSALGYTPLRRGGLLLFTGGVSSALGTAAGYFGASELAQGDRLERFLGSIGIIVFEPGLYVVSGLPTAWIPEQARFYALCSFGVGLLFTLIPAARAALLPPVEALRYE